MNRSEKFWNICGDELHAARGEFYWSRITHGYGVSQMLPENSYWRGDGIYECQRAEISKLVPSMGRVKNPRKNKHLEHFRAVSNAYYDMYNNGGWNRPSQIYQYAGKRTLNNRYVYMALEIYLDYVILAAHAEQIGLDREVQNVV